MNRVKYLVLVLTLVYFQKVKVRRGSTENNLVKAPVMRRVVR